MKKELELTIHNVCVDLRNKHKQFLSQLKELLDDYEQYAFCSDKLDFALNYYESDINLFLEFDTDRWVGSDNDENKHVVTLEELEQILKETKHSQFN